MNRKHETDPVDVRKCTNGYTNLIPSIVAHFIEQRVQYDELYVSTISRYDVLLRNRFTCANIHTRTHRIPEEAFSPNSFQPKKSV